MQIINEPGSRLVKAWVDGVQFEPQALMQVMNTASLPFIHKHIAVMPDVHLGIGATVGSVIPTRGAIIPAAVGVDIGCGMMAVKTPFIANQLPDNLNDIRSSIEAETPHGRTNNGDPSMDQGSWRGEPSPVAWKEWLHNLKGRFADLLEKHPDLGHRISSPVNQIGTLGGGNHFIELCLDEDDAVWVMLHSGSRGIGNRIGSTFIQKAKKDMERWFIHLPDADLAYFPEGSENFDDYIEALMWAQDFARVNREIMMTHILRVVYSALGNEADPANFRLDFRDLDNVIACHHNYVTRENHFKKNVWVTRKGAVRAREGDMGIIPGSMGAKSYIVRGKGNPESFHSCSHGAGRVMSRRGARETFTLEDHRKATAGVSCKKDESVLDETPGAYKDIDAVMAAQEDLVDIVHTLKQVLCVKG